MKAYKWLLFLVVIGFLSFNVSAQKPDNTKPMYGEIPAKGKLKMANEIFKQNALAQTGTIDSAARGYADLAWRYFYHHDLETAMKRFNQVWLLNPEFPDAYFGFAALMDMQDNKTEAERFYKIGQEKDITKERAQICYQRIADCKEQFYDFVGAVEACAKLIEMNPNNVFVLKKIGYFQMFLGNSQEALIAYAKAIELDSTDATTYNNRAYLYQTEKNYESAIADYTKAIELDAEYISAYVNRGVSLMEDNRLLEAKSDFEICVQLDSESGELRRFLGLCKLNLQDKTGACEDFKLAKEFGDTEANYLMEKNCQ